MGSTLLFIMKILLVLLTISFISLATGQLCCSTAQTKCATGCAGRSCDIKCSSKSTCCFFGQCATCGPWTCGQMTNACTSTASVTTTTTAPTTTTTTTTTTAACQAPGNAKCWDKSTSQLTGDPCCDGSECLPWLGSSGVAGHSYCQFRDCIASGGSCNARKGTCCTGTACTSGTCQ